MVAHAFHPRALEAEAVEWISVGWRPAWSTLSFRSVRMHSETLSKTQRRLNLEKEDSGMGMWLHGDVALGCVTSASLWVQFLLTHKTSISLD